VLGNHRPVWAPDDIDIERPSVARMYDYYLGGSHNFAADRHLAEQAMAVWPDSPHIARANRALLRRVLSYLHQQGVEQFLDLGSGIPTVGNVHEVASGLNPLARTVYVDRDPVAVAHSATLLADVPTATVLHADLREPAAVLHAPEVRALLDLDKPVAVLMMAALHFVPDSDDPAAVVAAYREASAPGSFLALSHATADYQPERIEEMAEVYQRSAAGLTARSREQLAKLLTGYDLVPPGIVDMILWQPDPEILAADPLAADVTRYSAYAAVGRRS
jgi:hypothetical protein